MNAHRTHFLKTKIALAVAVLTLSACATMDQRPYALDDARIAVDAARANPQVGTLAAGELNDAISAYQRAESTYRAEGDSVEVRHLAYVARDRAAIAQESANLRSAEQSVANATAERDRVRLLARTAEAENATRAAQLAQLRADVTRREAIEAERQALAAQQQARLSQQDALVSQQQARAAEARAALLETELRELAAIKTDRGMVVTLSDVLFDTGSATLRPGGQRVVARLAEFLREYPERTLAIEGFTDSVGGESYNQVLSERRATAVRVALLDAGIAGSRIDVRGYGPQYPVASNGTPEGRQRNRRVEVVISDERGTIGPRIARYVVPTR
jgi:outer membrane protein OmpA-like peptidoglycan-associated protein